MLTTLTESTRSGFFSLHVAMFLRTFTTTDCMLFTASAPHVHALSLPLEPTGPSLGHTPSISANTSKAEDNQDAC